MATPMFSGSRVGLYRFIRGNYRLAQPVRLFYQTTVMSGAHDAEFKSAQERVLQLKEAPDNQVKLKLYALFKQATIGKNTTKKPGAFDMVGKYKWNAWNDLGDMSQDDAQKNYVQLVNELVSAEGGSPPTTESAAPSDSKFKDIVVTTGNNMCTIRLNRPHKKNAFTRETYAEVCEALSDAEKNDCVRIAVITGTGDYYSSGNDLSNFMNINMDDIPKMAKDGRYLLLKFVSAFIEFKKPLICVCNGPAVGVACTTMALCDVVYAKESATFQTPMVALGQSAEGASTVQFTRVMGQGRANEMLLFGRKITAKKACDWGLITEVYPDATFDKDVENRLKEIAQLPKQSLQYSKELIRGMDKELLCQANEKECELLEERWQSTECMEAVMNFFQKQAEASPQKNVITTTTTPATATTTTTSSSSSGGASCTSPAPEKKGKLQEYFKAKKRCPAPKQDRQRAQQKAAEERAYARYTIALQKWTDRQPEMDSCDSEDHGVLPE